MEKDRREEQQPGDVHPEEGSIPTVELAGEREPEREEPEQTQHVEVRRGRDPAPSHVDDRSYAERKDSDGSQKVVNGDVPLREGLDRQRNRLASFLANDLIGDLLSAGRGVESKSNVGRVLDGLVIEQHENIAHVKPGARRRPVRIQMLGGDSSLLVLPEDAVIQKLEA